MAPKKLGFNEYVIMGDKTIIFIYGENNIKLETIIDTKNLGKVKNTNLHFRAVWGHFGKSYYARATKHSKSGGKDKQEMVYLHHLILPLPIPGKTYHVDHKNHDTLDNREDNLKIGFARKNLLNRIRENKNNKTGCRNVCQVGNRLYVQLQIDGKNTLLKTFALDQLEEASIFAKKMRQKYYYNIDRE